jgi:hypothetical protein
MRTIVEQTLEKLSQIFSEEELDKKERKERGKSVRKLNKTKIKKSIEKNKRKKRDTETLELRSREKAIRDKKKDLMKLSNVKDASSKSLSKKGKIEDKLDSPAIQTKVKQDAKRNFRDLIKKEKEKNKKD